MEESAAEAILSKLRTLTAHPERIHGLQTEVYYDTRLQGEDGWELIDFIIERFHADFSSMNVGQFLPHEGVDLRILLVLIGMRPFPSLTVGRLVEAVEHMEWREVLEVRSPPLSRRRLTRAKQR